MAGRSSSSDVSLLCCAPLRHCWLAQTDCPLCGFLSSMRRGELSGRRCSELADTYLEKVFVESLDHSDGPCSLRRSFLPSFFGVTTRKTRNASWTRRKRQRPMMPDNKESGARQIAQTGQNRFVAVRVNFRHHRELSSMVGLPPAAE